MIVKCDKEEGLERYTVYICYYRSQIPRQPRRRQETGSCT